MMAASQPEHEHDHEVSGTSGTAPRPAGPAHAREPAPAPAPAHEPPAQRGRLRGRLGRWMTAAAVTVVVAALAAVLLGRPSDGASTSWHTYHDPFGLFTLRVPPGWATHFTPTTGTFGDRNGMETERVDMVSFDNPAQGTGSAYVLVTAYPIKTAFDHELNCQQPANLQPFTPLTLSSMEPSGYRLFTTETAGFQVDVSIPGVVIPVGFGPPTPVPTPIPASWVATDKTVVNALLVSFQPTDPKPLTC